LTTNEQRALGTGQVYDFDLNDYGVQPDYEKEFLNGKVLYIHGLSESSFDGDFATPARSVLHTWPSDPAGIAPWGSFFSEDSPIVRQTEEMQRKGKVPFVARLVLKNSEKHKGQTYWTMERYTLQWDANGVLVDPNAAPQEKKLK